MALGCVAMIAQAGDFEELLKRAATEAMRAAKDKLNSKPQQTPPPQPEASAPTPLSTAQGAFPQRDITLVSSPSADGPARVFADALRPVLRRGVSVNQPDMRSSAPLAGNVVARAAADGYTLLFDDIGIAMPFAADGLLRGHARDLEYVGLVAEEPVVLIGRAGLSAATFAELQQWLVSGPEQARFVVEENRSALSHLCARLLSRELQVTVATVVVQSMGEMTSRFAANQADLACVLSSRWVPMIESGSVRAFALGARTRPTQHTLARLPTFHSLGLDGMPAGSGFGLYAPAGTPAATLAELNAALTRVARDPEWSRRLTGATSAVMDERNRPTAHRAFVQEQVAKWSKGLDPAAAPGAATAQMPSLSDPTDPGACGPARVGRPATSDRVAIDMTGAQVLEARIDKSAGFSRGAGSFTFLKPRFEGPELLPQFEQIVGQPMDPKYYATREYKYQMPDYATHRAAIDGLQPPERTAMLAGLLAHARYFGKDHGVAGMLGAFPEMKSVTYFWGRPLKIRMGPAAGAWDIFGSARDKPPGVVCHGSLEQFLASPAQSRWTDSKLPDSGTDWYFPVLYEGMDATRVRALAQ
jgi:tripartite-type tricarboxylate transporter receptor subunit TctC